MSRWAAKADALWGAWVRVTGSGPPNLNALYLGLAQAEHESLCGDCWDHCGNWGCCDLRALNEAERAAFAAGDLRVGMWLYPDGTWGIQHQTNARGTIRGDSDPNSGAFHVWFATFADDVSGAAYYLRYANKPCLQDEACTAETFATALYVACYYGGVHAGSRPCGSRHLPFNAAELANIHDYTTALTRQLVGIVPALKDWIPPGMTAPDKFTEFVGGADDTLPPQPTDTEPGEGSA